MSAKHRKAAIVVVSSLAVIVLALAMMMGAV